MVAVAAQAIIEPQPAPARRLRVLHIITRMIVGGAQENTMLSCTLIDPEQFSSTILSGVETGVEGELLSECRAAGVSVHLEPTMVRRVHPFLDVVCLFRLIAFMRRERFDVVHTHIAKAGIVGRLAAWVTHAPVVIHTAHSWPFHREDSPFTRWTYVTLERLCSRFCDVIVVVSNPDHEHALALAIGRPDQYALIRSGIEIERFRDACTPRAEIRAEFGIPADAFVVGTVGRLVRQKAPLDLLAAFALLAQRRPDAHLLMVGDGPLRAQVEADIAGRGLSGRVHITGVRRDVPELQRAFDVFALSSHWEGMPRVVPQAMAAGLPVVATRAFGTADSVVDGENGWLVAVGDTRALGERLIALADAPETARRMGEVGRSRVGEFSARRMVDQLSDLYRSRALARGVA